MIEQFAEQWRPTLTRIVGAIINGIATNKPSSVIEQIRILRRSCDDIEALLEDNSFWRRPKILASMIILRKHREAEFVPSREKRRTWTSWTTVLPSELNLKLMALLEEGNYRTKTDLLKDILTQAVDSVEIKE